MKEYAGDEIKRARHTHVQTIYLPTICLGVIFVRVIVLTCGVCMCVSVGGGGAEIRAAPVMAYKLIRGSTSMVSRLFA